MSVLELIDVVHVQADFEDGVLSQVDTTTNPGDVILATTSNWYDSDWTYRRIDQAKFTKRESDDGPANQTSFWMWINNF